MTERGNYSPANVTRLHQNLYRFIGIIDGRIKASSFYNKPNYPIDNLFPQESPNDKEYSVIYEANTVEAKTTSS